MIVEEHFLIELLLVAHGMERTTHVSIEPTAI